MITPHLDTLQQGPDDVYTDKKGKTYAWKTYSIEITIKGDRRRVACSVSNYPDGSLDSISLFGLAVRFRTGTKVWPGSAVYWGKTSSVNNLRPNIDKFNGQFCQLVGYFEDHEASKHRSLHNAVA
jgi:hypothetical protein